MIFYIHTINLLYAVAGLAVLGLTLILFYDYFFNGQKLYTRFVDPYVWPIIALVTFGGIATTLLYSEYFGFIPCSLCWLQRVALYPQALIVFFAYRKRDISHFPLYGMVLSTFGFIVAVYHYIYQMIPTEALQSGIVPCLADGSADCGEKIIEVFGFVTFPFLSAILFAFLIAIYLHLRRAER